MGNCKKISMLLTAKVFKKLLLWNNLFYITIVIIMKPIYRRYSNNMEVSTFKLDVSEFYLLLVALLYRYIIDMSSLFAASSFDNIALFQAFAA